MDISSSTNITAYRPDGGKNGYALAIETMAKAGYKVIDINFCEAMNPKSRLRTDEWEKDIKIMANLAERYGLSIRQAHLPYYDIFQPMDEDARRLMENIIEHMIHGAGMLGVEWAVTHTGTDYAAGPDMRRSFDRNIEYFSKHLRTAEAAGIGLALENDFEYKSAPYQRVFGASIPLLVELVDTLASEHVGICYDFGHAQLTGGFHYENLQLIGHRLKAIHLADNLGMRDDHLLPFFGVVDWDEAMRSLAAIDYRGDLAFEVQGFSRQVPTRLKHHVVELSLEIGEELKRLFLKHREG